jgi:hypothetical protein
VTETAEPHLPVSPVLFDLVTAYAGEIETAKALPKGPLKQKTPIVEFCRSFFAQFFENVLGQEITGIDSDTKLEATTKRLELEGEREHTAEPAKAELEAKVSLISSFEDLCEMWPDVLGFSYGGSASEYKRFHTTYVPELLAQIETWANAASEMAIAERAREALAVYKPAATRFARAS